MLCKILSLLITCNYRAMNYLRSFVLILIVLPFPVNSQQRIAAGPAFLQLKGLTIDGSEISASSKKLNILYEQGYAKGELPVNTVSSENDVMNELISNVADKVLYFSIKIPEGRFTFGDSMDEQFLARGEMSIGEVKSEFEVDFNVSNIKSSKNNNFQVTGNGGLSLWDNLAVEDTLGLRDSFRFVFTQNLKLYTP